MTIKASMILRSKGPYHPTVKTMSARYPRIIHAEHLRHRVFSFSVSSSRAISVESMIGDVEADPFIPLVWRSAKKGMVAGVELHGADLIAVRDSYMRSLENALREARVMASHNAAKEVVNRILEPYGHVNLIMTGTDWANFYALRRHEAAEPHMQILANAVYDADWESRYQTQELEFGEWHLPLVMDGERHMPCSLPYEERDYNLRLISAARCAGGSYLLNGTRRKSLESDIALGQWLVNSNPVHASPMEHVVSPDKKTLLSSWKNPKLHGNLRGYIQFRKTIPNDFVKDAE